MRRCAPLLVGLLCACTGSILEPTAPMSPARPGPSAPPSPTAPPDHPRDAGTPDDAGTPPGPTGAPVIERSTARRLTHSELTATLTDVFGAGVPVAVAQLPDENLTPFDNDVQEQAASMRLVEATEAISIEVAAWVVADAARLRAALPCAPASATDAACFADATRSLGRRLWRRPLEPAEVDAAAELLTDATAGGTFGGAVAMLIRYLILHPAFLYRIERGLPDAPTRLSAYEIATRLALLLHGRAPDPALLDAAASGALDTADGRRAQAERLLASAAGREQQRRFVALWLGYSRLQTGGLERKMRAESDALVDRAFAPGADFRDLFSSDDTFVDAELAAHYGLTGASTTAAFVPYGTADRRGILSHGSFSVAGAKFNDTSPTRRGRFVRERLFCQRVSLPTANVDVDQPPRSEDPNACKIDRYVAHRTEAQCAGCHSQTDPIGFGLENLDQLGRYRTHDEGRPECVIAGEGQLDANTPFRGPRELAARVSASDRLATCLAEHLVRFSGGRTAQAGDDRAARWMADQLERNGHSVRAMLLAWVAHENFVLRQEEP